METGKRKVSNAIQTRNDERSNWREERRSYPPRSMHHFKIASLIVKIVILMKHTSRKTEIMVR
jgi:hypothetical protein